MKLDYPTIYRHVTRLLDTLDSALTDYTELDIHSLPLDTMSRIDSITVDGARDDHALLEELKQLDEGAYKFHVLTNASLELMNDLHGFLCQSMDSFEKGLTAPGFALLRKPLKEHMLYLCWMAADPNDFVQRYSKDPHSSLKRPRPERITEILQLTIDLLENDGLYEADLIYRMVYKKDQPGGFETPFQKATHLVTSQGVALKTPDHILNFIYEDDSHDEYGKFVLERLPYLLLFVSHLCFYHLNRITRLNKYTYSYYVLSQMAIHEAIFIPGRMGHVGKLLNKMLGPLLECIHCEATLGLTKKSVPAFFMDEEMFCRSCGLISPVPTRWLFAKAKLSLVDDEKGYSLFDEILDRESLNGSETTHEKNET